MIFQLHTPPGFLLAFMYPYNKNKALNPIYPKQMEILFCELSQQQTDLILLFIISNEVNDKISKVSAFTQWMVQLAPKIQSMSYRNGIETYCLIKTLMHFPRKTELFVNIATGS